MKLQEALEWAEFVDGSENQTDLAVSTLAAAVRELQQELAAAREALKQEPNICPECGFYLGLLHRDICPNCRKLAALQEDAKIGKNLLIIAANDRDTALERAEAAVKERDELREQVEKIIYRATCNQASEQEAINALNAENRRLADQWQAMRDDCEVVRRENEALRRVAQKGKALRDFSDNPDYSTDRIVRLLDAFDRAYRALDAGKDMP